MLDGGGGEIGTTVIAQSIKYNFKKDDAPHSVLKYGGLALLWPLINL